MATISTSRQGLNSIQGHTHLAHEMLQGGDPLPCFLCATRGGGRRADHFSWADLRALSALPPAFRYSASNIVSPLPCSTTQFSLALTSFPLTQIAHPSPPDFLCKSKEEKGNLFGNRLPIKGTHSTAAQLGKLQVEMEGRQSPPPPFFSFSISRFPFERLRK